MDEIEEIPTQDTEQQVVQSAPGDWLMVGLAGLVLGGGLLIAAINVLGLTEPDASATASSAAATGDLSPSASPMPSALIRELHEKTVDPATSGPPPPVTDPFSGPNREVEQSWLEATGEVVIWSNASVTSQETGTLRPGEVALVEPDSEASGWLKTVNSLNLGVGYIDASDQEARAAYNLYPAERVQQSGIIYAVRAVGDRLLADVSLPGDFGAKAYSSKDGEHWAVVEEVEPQVVARGPSGWFGLTRGVGGGTTGAWESHDGVSWDFTGRLYYLAASTLVGSDLGYMLVNSISDIRYAPTVWYSPDGLTWQESVDPFGRSGSEGKDESIELLATDRAFIAWTSPGRPRVDPRADLDADGDRSTNEHNVPLIAISRDGHQWDPIAMEDADVTGALQVAVVGDRLLAVAATPGVRTRAWGADLSATGSFTLDRDPELEAGIGTMGSIEIASNGREVYVLAYDNRIHPPAGIAFHVWRGDGRAWTEVGVPGPDQIGPAPRMGAVGPEGLVLIGSRPTSAGDNPIIWHLRASGSWVAEPTPLLDVVPGPTGETCGSPPSTALQFVLLPASWGSGCFGDQPLTFATWAGPGPSIPGCSPVLCPGTQVLGAPEWLMRDGPDLLLSPIAWAGDSGSPAYLDPHTDFPDLGNQWVLVTGHFADPASSTCEPSAAGFEEDWGISAIEFCRQHFVVTEATVIDGP